MPTLGSNKENEQSSRFPWPLFILLGEMFSGFACFVSFSGVLAEVPRSGQRSMQLCALGMIILLMVIKAVYQSSYSWVWPAAFLLGMSAACRNYDAHSLLVALISASVVHGAGVLLARAFRKHT